MIDFLWRRLQQSFTVFCDGAASFQISCVHFQGIYFIIQLSCGSFPFSLGVSQHLHVSQAMHDVGRYGVRLLGSSQMVLMRHTCIMRRSINCCLSVNMKRKDRKPTGHDQQSLNSRVLSKQDVSLEIISDHDRLLRIKVFRSEDGVHHVFVGFSNDGRGHLG